MWKLFVASWVIALTPGQAKAQIDPFNAGRLREACASLMDPLSAYDSATGRLGLEGICVGAVGATMAFGPMMNEQFRFCPPAGITLREAIPILLRYLDDNPEALKSDLRQVANYVGRLTWPCGK